MIGETLKRNRKAMIIQFVIGMVVGGVAALVVLDYGPELGLEGGHAPALLLAMLLVVMGLFIAIGSFTRAGAAQMVGADIEAGEDITPELNLLRWQGVVSVLAGAELFILGFDPDVLGGADGTWLLPLLLMILAAQTWVNLILWRRGDEFFRRVISEAGIIGFVAFQFLLFFWTAGVRFGLSPDPEAIDVYVLMMALYLLGSGIAGVRHGYGMKS